MRGKARHGKARRGWAWHGGARHGLARQGKARYFIYGERNEKRKKTKARRGK